MSNDDAGVTLIELLVCMLILTIISTALATSFMASSKSITKSSLRMDNTHDSQMVSSFFERDAQGAETVSTSDTSCGGTTPLVSFTWFSWDQSQPTPVQVKNVASYVVIGPGAPGGERQLVRQFCTTTGGALSSPSSLVVAHNLKLTGGSSDPKVLCYSSGVVTGATVACNSSTSTIAVIQLTATAQAQTTDDDTFFTYVASATLQVPA